MRKLRLIRDSLSCNRKSSTRTASGDGPSGIKSPRLRILARVSTAPALDSPTAGLTSEWPGCRHSSKPNAMANLHWPTKTSKPFAAGCILHQAQGRRRQTAVHPKPPYPAKGMTSWMLPSRPLDSSFHGCRCARPSGYTAHCRVRARCASQPIS